MPETHLARGAVVRCDSRTWIVWTYPAGAHGADPIALPLEPQTGPRHRSHVRLDFAGRASIVRLLRPTTIPRSRCERLGQCGPDIVASIAVSMRRALEADAAERRAMPRI
jgi:hypothetical protein